MGRRLLSPYSSALLSVAVASSCGGEKKTDDTQEPPPPAFSGELTSERILGVKGVVEPFDDWDRALARLESKVGKATRVEGHKYQWAVVEGESCTYVEIEVADRGAYQKGKSGLMVGSTQEPMKVDKTGALMNYRECLKIAGKTVGPAEDPNAEGPPADGSPVALQKFIDWAIKGRSKWDKRRIKVDARLDNISVTTWTSGDIHEETITAQLIVAEDKTEPAVRCTFKRGDKKPETQNGKPHVIADGTVKVEEWVNLAGDAGLSASLEDCGLTFVKDEPSTPKKRGSKQ